MSRSSANGGESETFNKVHHDLDVAAERRKPIVTEHKYKVNVAEPGVETLPLADHDGLGTGSRKTEKKDEGYSAKKTTVTKTSTSTSSTTAGAEKKQQPSGESQKGQFIAKPDVYNKGHDDDDEDESGGGGFPWVPVLAGGVALVGAIAGAMFYRKRKPEVDAKVRRSVEDADHRVKGALGSGERKVKEIIGSGQQKVNSLLHRGQHHDGGDHHDEGHGRMFGSGSTGDYQVKQGDNLTKIAKKSGKKSWHEIAEKNPSLRNPDLIYPGERLNL